MEDLSNHPESRLEKTPTKGDYGTKQYSQTDQKQTWSGSTEVTQLMTHRKSILHLLHSSGFYLCRKTGSSALLNLQSLCQEPRPADNHDDSGLRIISGGAGEHRADCKRGNCSTRVELILAQGKGHSENNLTDSIRYKLTPMWTEKGGVCVFRILGQTKNDVGNLSLWGECW